MIICAGKVLRLDDSSNTQYVIQSFVSSKGLWVSLVDHHNLENILSFSRKQPLARDSSECRKGDWISTT
jgi:hypothetical protein